MLFHPLDDGTQLDAHGAVRADRDSGLRVALHRGDQLVVGRSERFLPHLREGVRLNEVADRRLHQRRDPLRRGRLQRLQRLGGDRPRPQGDDAVEHLRGDLLDVDVLLDHGHRLIGDESLDARIVGERGIGGDEGVRIRQLGFRPRGDHRDWRQHGPDDDQDRREQGPAPSAALRLPRRRLRFIQDERLCCGGSGAKRGVLRLQLGNPFQEVVVRLTRHFRPRPPAFDATVAPSPCLAADSRRPR